MEKPRHPRSQHVYDIKLNKEARYCFYCILNMETRLWHTDKEAVLLYTAEPGGKFS